MDDDIRALERALADDPSNRETRLALETARRRIGLGWFGEALPPLRGGPLVPDDSGKLSDDGSDRVYPDRVYVKNIELPRSSGPLAVEMVRVGDKSGFWIARYPVVWSQYLKWADATGRVVPERPAKGFIGRPVTNVPWTDALAFCEWSEMDLPTLEEWTHATLGGPEHGLPCASCDGRGGRWEKIVFSDRARNRVPSAATNEVFSPCAACGRAGKKRRAYPWGDDDPDETRAVLPGVLKVEEPWKVRVHSYVRRNSDATVVIDVHDDGDNLVPARPGGASPYGVQDGVGNVREWVRPEGHVVECGSWKEWPRPWMTSPAAPGDDIGFRPVIRDEPTADAVERRRGRSDALAGHGPALFGGEYMVGYRRGRAEIGSPMEYLPPKGDT